MRALTIYAKFSTAPLCAVDNWAFDSFYSKWQNWRINSNVNIVDPKTCTYFIILHTCIPLVTALHFEFWWAREKFSFFIVFTIQPTHKWRKAKVFLKIYLFTCFQKCFFFFFSSSSSPPRVIASCCCCCFFILYIFIIFTKHVDTMSACT